MQNFVDYEYWTAELDQPGCRQRDDDLAVPCGYWRIVGADTGCDWPLAIWRESDGSLRFFVGVDPRRSALWDSGAGLDFQAGKWRKARAVSHDAWTAAVKTGHWSDGRPINATRAHSDLVNAMPASGDAWTDISREFEDAAESAGAIIKRGVKTGDDADLAAGFAKRVSLLGGRAAEAFEAEKRPWLEGGRAVDSKWRPLRDNIAALVAGLKSAADEWLRQQRLAAEAAKRAAEAEAERLRQEVLAAERAAAAARAEQEASAADADAVAAAEEEARRAAELAAAAAAQAAAPVRASAGRTGAKLTQRRVYSALIEDYDLALAHFARAESIMAEVQRLANHAAVAGVPVPGCKRVESFKTV